MMPEIAVSRLSRREKHRQSASQQEPLTAFDVDGAIDAEDWRHLR